MPGRRAKAWILVFVFVVLAVEGYFLYRYYERHSGPDAAVSGVASGPAGPKTVEDAVSETARDAVGPNPGEKADETTFVHKATNANSRGDYTYLSDPRLNGDPDAVVLAVPSWDGTGSDAYGHNTGVWYEPGKKKWAIFNQDLAAVPAGAAFEVVVPPASERFVHRAGPANTVGNATYLDGPLVDGEPDAAVSVTQNWNPGGGGGVYNDHPVGVLYDVDVDKWFVYNEDGASMPQGAAFSIAVSGEAGRVR